MPRALHILRTRRFRLLASVLVMLAILCNGIGLAMAHSEMAKQDCCAEMMDGKMSSEDMSDSCPPSKASCDDQCMLRCFAANAWTVNSFALSSIVLVTTSLPSLQVTGYPLAELGPNLRPPIYS